MQVYEKARADFNLHESIRVTGTSGPEPVSAPLRVIRDSDGKHASESQVDSVCAVESSLDASLRLPDPISLGAERNKITSIEHSTSC